MAPSKLDYALNAQVTGLSTSGAAQIQIPDPSSHGGSFALAGTADITDALPAAEFPFSLVGGQPVSCTTGCESEMPLLFTDEGTFAVTSGCTDRTAQRSLRCRI